MNRMALLATLALAGCAADVPHAKAPVYRPSSIRLYVETGERTCVPDRLPRPRFYAGTAEMQPRDVLDVDELGRCLASPAFAGLRVQLEGGADRPDRTEAARRLALDRANRVERALVTQGVSPDRIATDAAPPGSSLAGRVRVGLFR